VVSSRVTRYERGTSEPDFTTADRLAKELNLPLSSLLAETDVMAELIRALSGMTQAEQKRLLARLRSGQSR
jgi:transcriptional regulator with XRE-family HTH domain